MRDILKVKLLLGASAVLLVLFIVSLVWTFYAWDVVLEDQVNKQVRLENDTIQWERFVDLPFPIDLKAYIFHVDNADKVLTGAEEPNLIEKGPYVYKETKHKTILREDSLMDTVTYYQTSKFTFDKDASKGDENDIVTVINPLLLTVLQKATFGKDFIQQFRTKIFGSCCDNLFMKVKVRDLLIDGINFAVNDPHDPPGIISYNTVAGIIRDIAKDARNADMVKIGDQDGAKFSLVGYKQKPDGNYTLSRGIKNINSLGYITSWNDKIYIENWGTEHPKSDNCSYIHGTDSTLYPPHLEENRDFTIYNTDICRMVHLFYKGTKSHKGVEGFLFKTSEKTLRPATEKADDDCYCVKKTKNENGDDDCYLNGAMDLQTCNGSPVILSFPHFLWADEKRYRTGIKGLNPDEEKHGINLLVEPNTGTPMEGNKRIQINAVLRPEEPFSKAKPRIFPIVWFDEGISLEQKYVDELNDKYFNKKKIAEGLSYSFIALTAFGCIAFGAWGFIKKSHLRR